MGNVIWVGDDEFGKTTVNAVAAELRLGANRFLPSQTVFAVTTR